MGASGSDSHLAGDGHVVDEDGCLLRVLDKTACEHEEGPDFRCIRRPAKAWHSPMVVAVTRGDPVARGAEAEGTAMRSSIAGDDGALVVSVRSLGYERADLWGGRVGPGGMVFDSRY